MIVRRALVLAALGMSAGVIALRGPDVFTNPQFWAEDGLVWYANAYNAPGTGNLMLPYGGYLQTFPRFAGLASQLVDFASAPLLMAVLALLVQMIAPAFLLSDRLAWAVPRRTHRLALAAVLLVAPNVNEVHVNVTNSHVHLAVLALLVLLAEPRATLPWRVFDVAVLALSGFSGPFCLLLAPAAALCCWHWRDRWSLVRLLCVLVPAAIQVVMLTPPSVVGGRPARSGMLVRAPRTPHGASLENLLEIFGGQIVAGGLTGVWSYARLHAGAFAAHPWLPAVLGAAGIAFLVRAAYLTTSFALRIVLLFATLHMGAGLASPIIVGTAPLWEMLQLPGAGQRYYYSMTLAFLATILWTVVADPRRAMRGVAALALAVLVLVGIPGDFSIPPRVDLDFPRQARRLAKAPPGKLVKLRIPPEPFDMTLIRGCEPPHVPFKNDRQAHRLRSRRACPDR